MSMHVYTYMYMHVLWYMHVLHVLVVSHGVVSHFSSVVEEIEIGQPLITRILPIPPSLLPSSPIDLDPYPPSAPPAIAHCDNPDPPPVPPNLSNTELFCLQI